MFTDNFDRAVLGDDWVTPGRYGELGGWGSDPGILSQDLIIHEPGLVVQDLQSDTWVCCGAYTGLGELGNSGQFAEITIGNNMEWRDANSTVPYGPQYAYYLVYLHSPPAADESQAWTALRFWRSYYGPYAASNPFNYGPFYADIIVVNSVGEIVTSSSASGYGVYWSLEELGFTGQPFIFKGAKLRIEHVSGFYYGYIYSPITRTWARLMSAENTIASADGYPGFGMGMGDEITGPMDRGEYAASVTQFRCGQTVDNDTFLTSNSLTAADNASRSLTHGLSRDLFSSSNGLIRGIS